jgi:hypothetical protein
MCTLDVEVKIELDRVVFESHKTETFIHKIYNPVALRLGVAS